jgi:hypothetical protein
MTNTNEDPRAAELKVKVDAPKTGFEALKAGFEDGQEAAKQETVVGATFRGSAGSLRHRKGGDGYEKDEYSIGFRGGYSEYLSKVKLIRVDSQSVVSEIQMRE